MLKLLAQIILNNLSRMPYSFVRLAGGVSLSVMELVVMAIQNFAIEPEHAATLLGAISVSNLDIAKTHANHGVRKNGSSVATGLSNGTLGNVFVTTRLIDCKT